MSDLHNEENPFGERFSQRIFIINATFILLIHGVVFSTSKKDDYPPLVSNGNLHVWFWPGFPSVSNNLASARHWRTSPNYCPFILDNFLRRDNFTVKRKSEFSTEAGLKYLILGAFSSGILLFGCDWTTTDPFEKNS
ncbi:hypothetical protein LUZ63_023998 [Rhynchospora breviuscula]|uniref:Uncharacterized protein n=1 Tax=Rhynchospora breviuscula TaxID=2022672 RepID=A0A9P9Z2Z3_9POAL|nr:hypothetical protein LUZ63_023998 [Rhynchospora breviuscula]